MNDDDSVSLEVEFIQTRRFRKRVTMCHADASFVIKSPAEFRSRVAILGTPGETIELSSKIIIDTVDVLQINEA